MKIGDRVSIAKHGEFMRKGDAGVIVEMNDENSWVVKSDSTGKNYAIGSESIEIEQDKCKISALKTQEGGDHYRKMGMYQPWEVAFAQLTPEELKGAMKLTVISYLSREADKGGMQDIKKAAHTLQIYLELEARRATP